MASAIRNVDFIGSRLRPPPKALVLLEEEATDLKGDIVTQGFKNNQHSHAMPFKFTLSFVYVCHCTTPCLASVLRRSIIRADNLILVARFAFPLAHIAFPRALCLPLALCLAALLPLPDRIT